VHGLRVRAHGVELGEDQVAQFLKFDVAQLGDSAEQLLDLVHVGTPDA
jgi:hypothetical protein